MAHVEPQPARRSTAVALAAFGGFSLLVGTCSGRTRRWPGAAVFIVAALSPCASWRRRP